MVERNETKLPEYITEEERKHYEEKCLELAEKYKVVKVHAFVTLRANDPDNTRIVGYFHEPNYITKLTAMDKAMQQSPRIAANEISELCILREESSPEVYSDNPVNDRYRLGAAEFCMSIIKISTDLLKKN